MSSSLLSIIAILALIVASVAAFLAFRLQQRIKLLSTGAQGQSLEELLISHMKNLKDTYAEIEKVKKTNEYLDDIASRSIHKVGLVRFNPFQDTGSDQSFALALLDLYDNGVVVSSIHGREGTRTYAKSVHGGTSEHHLSQEEMNAIEQAKSGMNAPAHPPKAPAQPIAAPAPAPAVEPSVEK